MKSADAEKTILAVIRSLIERHDDADVELKSDSRLTDLGLDSLDVMSLLFDVEQAFDVKIAEEDIAAHNLLHAGKLADFLAERTRR